MSRVTPSTLSARQPKLRVLEGGPQSEEPAPGPEGSAETLEFDAVFRRYAPYVAAIGLKILGREEEIDDLVQEVFIDAHRGLDQLQDRSSLKPWLASIAVRRARRKLRGGWLGRLLTRRPVADYTHLADRGATPEESAHVQSVYRLLDRMPADERVAWVLRNVESESLERVAELCGCSLSTVQRRLRSAGRWMAQLKLEA